MLQLMIDDQGEIWRGDSRELRCAFDAPHSGGEFTEYAIKNLGFIAINVFGSSCQARLRPELITQRAVLTLLEWIAGTRLDRMVVSTFEKDWQSELLRMSDVPRRLMELVALSAQARPDDFLADTLAPSSIKNRPLLSGLVDEWPQIAKQFELEALARLLRTVFRERLVVVKLQDDTAQPVFHQVGKGLLYSEYDTWRSSAIGEPIEDQPDRLFGKWVADVYRDAATNPRPKIEAVDVIMRWPHAGRSRHRYKRLILPFQSPDATRFLFGGTIVDDTIDLRVHSG